MIDINNKIKANINRQFIASAVRKTCRALRVKCRDLSIAFVGRAEIKKINQKYRRKNQATDVLSFNYGESRRQISGEIVICYPLAKQHARENNHSVKKEITLLIVHSLLHIVGFTHSKKLLADKMEDEEKVIIKKIFDNQFLKKDFCVSMQFEEKPNMHQ